MKKTNSPGDKTSSFQEIDPTFCVQRGKTQIFSYWWMMGCFFMLIKTSMKLHYFRGLSLSLRMMGVNSMLRQQKSSLEFGKILQNKLSFWMKLKLKQWSLLNNILTPAGNLHGKLLFYPKNNPEGKQTSIALWVLAVRIAAPPAGIHPSFCCGAESPHAWPTCYTH